MQEHHVVGPVWINTSLQCRFQGKEARAVQTPTSPAPPRLHTPLFPIHNCNKQPHPNPQKASRQPQQLVLLQWERPAVASAKAELLVWLWPARHTAVAFLAPSR